METLSKKEIIIEYITAFTLTFIGGFTDAYTLIYRGGIFSNMQTGNLVKFVIGLSNLKFEIIYLIPIIVVVSLVSATAIGGFFFIRKRKEN